MGSAQPRRGREDAHRGSRADAVRSLAAAVLLRR